MHDLRAFERNILNVNQEIIFFVFNPDFALRNKYTSKPLKKADSSSNTV
jgi:hypothetical protein